MLRALRAQRRSAVAFDGQSSIDRERSSRCSRRDAGAGRALGPLWWTPRVHSPCSCTASKDVARACTCCRGAADAIGRLRAASARLPVGARVRRCCRSSVWRAATAAARAALSCDQDIAADGFFSLGMLAEFDASLAAYGPSFYRHLFWETGFVGQMLYLEAEAAGGAGTGIGCFYDDPVHEMLGLKGTRARACTTSRRDPGRGSR